MAPTAAAATTPGQAVTGSNFSAQPPPPPSSSLSSSSSSTAPASSAPQATPANAITTTTSTSLAASKSRSKHREHQPESGGPASKWQHSNESESLRSSQATTLDDDDEDAAAAAESASDMVRKSDEPRVVGVGWGSAGEHGVAGITEATSSQRIKTKSSPEALSTDLAVSGEASELVSSGRLAASAAAGCSNRYARFAFLTDPIVCMLVGKDSFFFHCTC